MSTGEDTHVKSPSSRVSERTSRWDYRVLYLVGRWWEIDDEFRFRSTIYLRGGSASGNIFWRASPVRGRPMRSAATWFPTETVSGVVVDRSVELAGCAADPGLALDVFRIELIGDDHAGVFGGKTLTTRKNWSGVMEGTYCFRNRKD